jgi:hypothetical protein
MGMDTGSFISALNASNPVGATDPKSQGDDHLRFIKAKLLETFPNVTGAVTSSHTELNLVAGATGGLATLSVSFAAAASSIAVLTSALSGFSFTASVTSSDITGSIRTPVLKTQAGYTAGTFTAATVTVNNKGIITNIAAGSIGSVITAGTQLVKNPVAINSTTTQAHGLGSTPFYIEGYLECLTAELGYSIGDKIDLANGAYLNSFINIEKDATNLVLLISNNVLNITRKDTLNVSALTEASWKMVLIPYKYV